MTRLSSPTQDLEDHYDVVVVGSGYGGAITASRLARAGRSVCLFEQGKELRPGEYPDTLAEAVDSMQIDFPEGHVGSRTALYNMHVDRDINVIHGCGLGGTSLINANVSLRADPRLFDDRRWPQALRDDVGTLIEEGYDRATEMLKPTPLPDHIGLHKLDALARSAAHAGGTFYRVPINVTFQDGVNHVGVEQSACTLCGDCVSGCNYGAKNTTLMNYLPDARNRGAKIFTQVDVRSVEPKDGKWLVHYQLLDTGREWFHSPTMFVSADIVVLAAGTLGSTEILLRSRAGGLPVSDLTGTRFTGNGDVLGFSYNGEVGVDGIGWGSHPPGRLEPVGPCITGAIDRRDTPDVEQGTITEEGSIPGALGPLLPIAFAAAADAIGVDTDHSIGDEVKEHARELDSLLHGPYRGAVASTQTYLVMAHDDAGGTMDLEGDRLRVRWPGVGRGELFDRISDDLAKATVPLGGTYLRNPLWTKILGDQLVTVHPLGGCPMGEDASSGVVNHKGQVFAGTEGTAVHEGLYVSDGAVIPRPLGVNPLLTISAVTERCCALIAADRGWTIDYSLPSTPPPPPPALKVGIEFTETMKGVISTTALTDFAAAERAGKEAGTPFSFILTIRSDDLDAMLADPQCEARMVGTVSAPSLSPDPITVTRGVFNLFVDDPEVPDGRRMRYRMLLTTEQGKRYWFTGFKLIHHDKPLDLWADTTTLFITVYDGEDDTGPVVAKGVLHILPEDFAIQMAATKAVNASDEKERLEATAKFGRFFAGKLYETYGGVATPLERFDPHAPPRKKRPLRVQAPVVHPFRTDDGVDLLLTRYQGGTKGPVILSHGLGVSSKIYSIDTIDTNLLEFLYAQGYDVWLLDYRASIDLPASSALQFTADDIAKYDYPAAVAVVLNETGAPSVQFVVHCFGATTFFMAMLAGLQGVRSAAVSQIATHVITPLVTRVKSELYLPTVLERLGINKMTAYTSANADWVSRLYDKLLDVVPDDYEELCRSATCHRITFMYSLLYEHDQLNELTHNALHEMFGVTPISALEHLALMVRKGGLRDAQGRDVYLPHLDRLAIPITFVHGAENACFLPKSTAKTLQVLRQANGPDLYQRYVVSNYGHIDCIFGKNAARDIYPLMLKQLEATL
ncbi:MAG: GMC family oxidoreductase N-terminal domain-containing protein [Acidimicrobiales bacterium]